MDYCVFRNQIKTGDLIAYSISSSNFKNRVILDAIRILTKSEFNHIGIAYENNGRLFLLEATRPCSGPVLLSKTASFYHISVNAEIADLHPLFNYIGLDYSYTKAIQSLYKNPSSDSDIKTEGIFCSELCVRIYKEYGIDIDYRNGSTPGAIVKTALARKGAKMTYVKVKSNGSW